MDIEFTIERGTLDVQTAVAFIVFEDDLQETISAADAISGGAASRVLRTGRFKGARKQTLDLQGAGEAGRVLLWWVLVRKKAPCLQKSSRLRHWPTTW